MATFKHQVAGHGTLLQYPTSDFMVIKPCTAVECEFYERSVLHPEYAVWMPKFFGCLRLASQQEMTMLPVLRDVRIEETAVSVDLPSDGRPEVAAIEIPKAAGINNILPRIIEHISSVFHSFTIYNLNKTILLVNTLYMYREYHSRLQRTMRYGFEDWYASV